MFALLGFLDVTEQMCDDLMEDQPLGCDNHNSEPFHEPVHFHFITVEKTEADHV